MADIDYSRVLFGTTNLADTATLLGHHFDAAYPVENLQHPSLLRAAVSNAAATNVQVLIDLGATPPSYDVLAIIRHGIAHSGSVSVYTGTAYSDAGAGATNRYAISAGSAVFDVESPGAILNPALLGGIRRDCWFAFANTPLSKRYIVIDIDDTSGTSPLSVSRIFLGKAVQPAAGLSYNYEQAWIDQTISASLSGGLMLRTRRFLPYRQASLNFDGISEADAVLLAETFEAGAGVAGADVLLVPFPDTASTWHHHTLWGRMVEAGPTVRSDYDWRTKSYKIAERMD